jgi:L-fucose isomerase-like protein
MAVVDRRQKVLFLPVIRGNYPAALTQSVNAAMQQAAAALGACAIFPPESCGDGGVLRSDDDLRDYWHIWREQLYDIKGLVVFSGDFMQERRAQDTVRLLPQDVPTFLIVNNDDPAGGDGRAPGDSYCGRLSVHHNLRMLGSRVLGSAYIDMHDADALRAVLESDLRIVDGIECLRNMRIGMFGVNPDPFATTFTNQLKLFELGFSLHTYELLTMWGDTVAASQAADDAPKHPGPAGDIGFWRPVRRGDPRVPEVVAKLRKLAVLTADDAHVEMMARGFLWMKDTFELDRLDAGAIHCWPDFARYFGMAPCTIAMLVNHLLKKPVVCELDICHAIMAGLGYALTGEASVILDLNNNGWDPRVFNAFHCSQTAPNWLRAAPKIGDYGSIEGELTPAPFTGICAATTASDFQATVFHGRFLAETPPQRGSSGWAYVPNLPDVLRSIEDGGIHHFVALKGHLGGEVAEILRFRGITVTNLAEEVGTPDDIEAEIGSPR